MSDPNDWNKQVIAEFRANGGKVGGYFEGANMVLLHTTGAKSGQERINPLVYTTDGDNLVIIASKGGADSNPDWYYNLLANPVTSVEVGTEQFEVQATSVTEEPERSRLYAKMVTHREGFAEYEQKTSRKIPAVVLERIVNPSNDVTTLGDDETLTGHVLNDESMGSDPDMV